MTFSKEPTGPNRDEKAVQAQEVERIAKNQAGKSRELRHHEHSPNATRNTGEQNVPGAAAREGVKSQDPAGERGRLRFATETG